MSWHADNMAAVHCTVAFCLSFRVYFAVKYRALKPLYKEILDTTGLETEM